jgi:hypothetical protein
MYPLKNYFEKSFTVVHKDRISDLAESPIRKTRKALKGDVAVLF